MCWVQESERERERENGCKGEESLLVEKTEAVADNTINLLPRIVKLRWNFKLDILSKNLQSLYHAVSLSYFLFVLFD